MADAVESRQNSDTLRFPAFTRLEKSDGARLLVESSKLFSRSLDAPRIYEVLNHVVCSSVDCDGLLVSSFNSREKLIRCEYAFVDGKPMDAAVFPPVPFNPMPGNGLQSEVIRTGEAKLFADIAQRVEQGRGKFYQVSKGGRGVEKLPKGSKPKCQSAIMAPLKLDDEVIGVLQVMADHGDAYCEEHLVFVEGLALQMAAALNNAELFAQMQTEISERIRAEQVLVEREEEVRRLNAELEARVLQRTAQLEQATMEMESFCYSVSHDLRQPLRGICGAAMMLLHDHHDEISLGAREHLESLALAANKMSKLIDDLLQYSRLSRRSMQKTGVNLSDIASRVVRTARAEGYERAQVSIRPDIEVDADPDMIGIVVDNLLSNALKFSSKNSRPQVEFGSTELENGKVLFVRDNGVGFDQAYAKKLFQPFERLHAETEFPGTGIGLANAKRIIERHGGMIWAEGKADEGATFYFTIP